MKSYADALKRDAEFAIHKAYNQIPLNLPPEKWLASKEFRLFLDEFYPLCNVFEQEGPFVEVHVLVVSAYLSITRIIRNMLYEFKSNSALIDLANYALEEIEGDMRRLFEIVGHNMEFLSQNIHDEIDLSEISKLKEELENNISDAYYTLPRDLPAEQLLTSKQFYAFVDLWKGLCEVYQQNNEFVDIHILIIDVYIMITNHMSQIISNHTNSSLTLDITTNSLEEVKKWMDLLVKIAESNDLTSRE